MNLTNKINTKNSMLIILLISTILIFLIINPEININAFYSGLKVWAIYVLPALFPFFFFTKILTELNVPQYISKYLHKITQYLFHTNGSGAYIYIMSILSGYPMGAKLTSEIFENNLISKPEAIRISAYTSTSGPFFIIGTIGVGLFTSLKIGLIILFSHFLGALINGIYYRNYKYKQKIETSNIRVLNKSTNILEDSMLNSIKSILIIGGYISIFFMLIECINYYNLFLPFYYVIQKICGLNIEFLSAFFNGIIEVTNGAISIINLNLPLNLSIPIITFLISFGGISILFQSYTFLKKIGISIRLYLFQKITHSLTATVISLILYFLIY